MSTLLIDAGNTRVKWAWLGADGRPGPVHACPHDDLTPLGLAVAQTPPQRGVGASVASPADNSAIAALVGLPVEWLQPTAERAGVRNGYRDPARLGADRWAALIGAHHEPGGDLLVVSAGTALTLDCLDRDGMFRGGTIAPGFALMRQSLARGTARLGYPEGDYAAYPQQTADAILSGCIDALVAPVERRAARFSADLGRPVRILIGGGDGMMLMSHLAVPAAIVDNLVLSGLALVAQPLC